MTAEVAILNRTAVALAADSAITIQYKPKETENIPRIYTTVNKLFTLSKYHPVGIMIYGGANILERPWEPIIKIYRKHLSNHLFDSLYKYAKNFAQYLGNKNLFSEDLQEAYYYGNLVSYYILITEEINKRVEKLFSENNKIDSLQINNEISKVISNYNRELKKIKFVDGMNFKTFQKFLTKYSSILNKAIAETFENLTISKENREKLREIGCYLYTKEKFPPGGTSGIVIAGYGNNDVFPSIVEYEVETVVDNKLKYREKSRYSIDIDGTAVIYPFAQYDVVHTFLKGIDPSYQNVLESYLAELLDKYPEYIIKALSNLSESEHSEIVKKLKTSGKKLLEEYIQKMNIYCHKNYVDPVVNSVANLPKMELADMAEALVSLTSFKRRVSADAETVGGPIDVALISKGDGFIWIKRKHYFKPELNYVFFQNYFKE